MFFFLLDKISSYHRQTQYRLPIAPDFTIESSSSLRKAVKTTQNSERVQDLHLASWAPKTQTDYNSHIRKWIKYCTKEGLLDPYMASYDQAMPFLSNLFYEEKGKYETSAIARSAFSAILPKINGQTF